MSLDIKTIAVFLPFLAGALYGLTYAVNGKILGPINAPTYLLVYCGIGILTALALHMVSPLKIDFSFVQQEHMSKWLLVSIVASLLAFMAMLLSIPLTSAVYTAAGEISYPLFTALFTYFIFQSREWSWSTVVGGLLIMTGSFIVVTGKLKVGG